MAEVGTTVRSITGSQTTAIFAELMLLTVDGAAPATTIAVPEGTTVFISDVIYGGDFLAQFAIQVDRGAGFKTIAFYNFFPTAGIGHTFMESYNVGLVINGGPGVSFRVIVLTPGATPVVITLRTYNQP